MGLRQKLLAAKSREEVNTLLIEGKKYLFASKKTQKAWQNAGNRALGLPVVIPPAPETATRKKSRKKKLGEKKAEEKKAIT